MSDILLGTPWPWWLIVLAAGGAGALTVRGYRRRAGELKPRLRRWLNALRLGAWGLLFLCLLQPIFRRFIPEEYASRVTVLVDDSESMSFQDGSQSPPRIEQVRTLLGKKDDGAGLLARLDRSFQVNLERFASGSEAIASPDELKAEGARTDLAKSLSDSFARLRGPDAGGLVLIGDGADTAKGDWLRAAKSYRRAGIPIYAIGVGTADAPDLAVAQVRCRRRVSKDTLVKVEVDVTRANIPAGLQTVRIVRNGRTIKESALDLRGERGTAVFDFLPGEQGFLEYEAVVEPAPGELVEGNNRLGFGVVAYNRKLRVLYMEGSVYQHWYYGRSTWSQRWEHEFLKLALEEDRDVEVDVLLKEFRGDLPGEIKLTRTDYPKTKKELYKYDVIINSDIPYQHFSDEQVQNTVDFVAKHGGGFVMIGGWDAFGEGGYAGTPMDRMLPVLMEKNDRHADGVDFRWRLTDKGWVHPIMQVDPDPKKNKQAWEKLNTLGPGGGPAFHGYSKTTRLKPAAELLAEVADEHLEGPYGPLALVAVQPFGAGHSMAFTTDCTGGWGAEWQDSWGDDPYDPDRRNVYYKNFWKNAIRWLAHKRIEKPNQLVLLETEKLVYGRGEEPLVRVKVLTQDYEPTHEAHVTLDVRGPDGNTQRFKLFPRYEEPGIFERKLTLDQVGRYELETAATLRGDELGTDKAIVQIRPSTEELRRIGQDVDTLEELAKASGGAYLPIERAEDLHQLLHEDTHIIQRHRDGDLWDNGWVFVAIILLLCTEWLLRKRAGLP